MNSNRAILATLAAIILTLVLFELTAMDIVVQDTIHEWGGGQWPVDEGAPAPRWAFYLGPKIAIVAFAVVLLAIAGIDRKQHGAMTRLGRVCIYILLCLATLSPAVAAIKAISHVHCPSQLTRYGGKQPYRKVFAPFPSGCCDPKRPGKCFPAGHATGGFALMALGLSARTRTRVFLGMATGMGAGWAMGLYQMLKGDHFLSHTVVTLFLALLFCQVLARITRVGTPDSGV